MSQSTKNTESADTHDTSVEIDIKKNGFIDKDGKLTVITSNTWGFINKEGIVVIPPIYHEVVNFSEGLASVHYHRIVDFSEGLARPPRVVSDAKVNFIDTTGTVVIPLNAYDVDYRYSKGFVNGLAKVREGFIDKQGTAVIPHIYDGAYDFSEGLVRVRLDGKYGFVDTTGKEVLPLIYTEACDFSEGLAKVRLAGKWGVVSKWCFIDTTGKVVIPLNNYDVDSYSESFSEGLARIKLDGKYGFVDKTGKEVIPPIYKSTGDFSEGLVEVELDKYGFVDKNGKVVIPLIYDRVCAFNEGLAQVELDNRLMFIDKTGTEFIHQIYDSICNFCEGLARVKLNGKWGFIDTTRKETIPLIYDNSGDFNEGLARVCLDGKWGFVDTTGKEVARLIYDNVGNFSEGLAKVKLDDKWGFIDTTGTVVIPIQYHGFGDFKEGLAKVFFNGKDSVANSLLHIKKLELPKMEGTEQELRNHSDEKQKLLQSAFWQETVSDDNYHVFVRTQESEYCSSPMGSIFFGVEFDDCFGWISLGDLISASDSEQFNLLDIIKPLTSFYFYLGSECDNLIQEFVNSDYTQTVERLHVGNSSFVLGSGFEYDRLTNILSQGHYPKLKEFKLGYWELYSNSHTGFGNIGSVTDVLKTMPNLEELGLYGDFLFEEPIELLKLETLQIDVKDETSHRQHEISQNTLDNTLNSTCPNVTELRLDTGHFYGDKVIHYTFTDDFCNGESFPQLRTLILSGNFVKEEIKKFEDSDFVKENSIKIHDYTHE